ncbi:hypothetical protein SEA_CHARGERPOWER_39 [Mycobacterium phage Chargerpower]|nr:hypothetical protein SEA_CHARGERPOWER_39 [Mycobacterium phage Chargerpower]
MSKWFRRKPKDRWPAWRPDQALTPENRTMIRPDYYRREHG